MSIVLLPFVYGVAGVEGHGILCRSVELGFQVMTEIGIVVDAVVAEDGVCRIDVERIDGRGDDMCSLGESLC